LHPKVQGLEVFWVEDANQIPYVSGADIDCVIDVDTLRRGGKGAQPG